MTHSTVTAGSMSERPYLANSDFIHYCAQQYRSSVVNQVVSPNDTMNNQYHVATWNERGPIIRMSSFSGGQASIWLGLQ